MPDARDFWDREIVEQQHVSWLEDPIIHEYANRSVGGTQPMWPLDWFQSWLGEGRRFGRALSIGCGAGPLERDLIRRDLCDSVDAFDGSVASLHLARRSAAAEGYLNRIRYFASDFNRPALPRNRYDIVFFHQSAHHVANLEGLFSAILQALRSEGLLYLDEYVGPSRGEWSDALIRPHREAWAALPAEARTTETVGFPIQQDDPSEAIRSSEIETRLSIGFTTVARRPYGGSLLSVLYPSLRRAAVTPSLVEALIEEERRLLAAGMPTYYAVIVARPKAGLARSTAVAAYALTGATAKILKFVARARRAAVRRLVAGIRKLGGSASRMFTG